MSEENVETVRRLLELFRNRDATQGIGKADIASAFEMADPDFELDATRVPMPELRGRYRGTEVGEFWSRWLEAWETVEVDVELTDAGDSVLADVKQHMRGKASGIEIDFPQHWQLFRFREGRIVGHVFFPEKTEALQAAGLSG